MSARVFVALLVGSFLFTSTTQAQTTWYVDDDAPDDPTSVSDSLEDGSVDHPFDAIQEAIDAASDGDVVLISDGEYTGIGNRNLDFGGRLIEVRSASNDPASCVINCEAAGRGFHFHSGETADAVVSGLTIRNGYVDGDSPVGRHGSGVLCQSSSPSIINCRISENTAGTLSSGAGVYCSNSSATMINCTISGNITYYTGEGGGVFCGEYCSVLMIDCLISGNFADGGGGGIFCGLGDSTFIGCTISRNLAGHGGGVDTFGSPVLINCTICDNEAETAGGGVACILQGTPILMNCTIKDNRGEFGGGVHCNNSNPVLTNCILWGNTTPEIFVPSGSVTASYCNIQGGWIGIGNIDQDPLLTSDGHLQATSPCRDAGDPDGSYEGEVDIDGEPRVVGDSVDIGPDEFLDTDDDGLPNWWEQFHFDSPEAADPADDLDLDGKTNLEEYVAGSDPHHGPRTYYVDTTGDDGWDGLSPAWDGEHGPKATIQAAIDVSSHYEHDTIIVADGTYTGPGNHDLDFQGRTVTLRTAGGDPASCRIDCRGDGRGFFFHSGETAACVVQGFTVTGADLDERSPGGPRGGGVFCIASSPTLVDCSFSGNRALHGGGMYSRVLSRPTLIGCNLSGNVVDGAAGGIYFYRSDLTLTNCTIAGNRSERGGGVYCNRSCPTLTGCTLWGNYASDFGGGGYFHYYSAPVLRHCILWGNAPSSIGASGNCDPVITYCNVGDGWAGEGNIAEDPLFADPDGPDDDPNTWQDNDYHLLPGSPCIDAGDPNFIPDPNDRDMDGQWRVWDGDLDDDCDVDLADLAELLGVYGSTCE